MAFKDFPDPEPGMVLLRRSLERGRLGHAYLFTGHQPDKLESLARLLAKTLNCRNPVRAGGAAVDCCDACLNCRKVDHETHPDVHWVRPESKSRVVTIDQMRDLMREIQLKPTGAEFKVGVIIAADRLNPQAANAFLKTLEEPPRNSVLVLLSTEPQRILETVRSRCLRLNFGGGKRPLDAASREWLEQFSEMAAAEERSLLGRYRLLDMLVKKLNSLKEEIERSLTAESPLERHADVERELREKWEKELAAGIEAEYRLQRADLLAEVQSWLRDVWLQTLAVGEERSSLPQLPATRRLAGRISPKQAVNNLQLLEQTQQLLGSNVQEALALEVCLLKLHL